MSHILILAAPRSGGGLVQEWLLEDDSFVRSSLSTREGFKNVQSGKEVSPELAVEISSFIEQGKTVVDFLPFYASDVELLTTLFPLAKLLFVFRRPIDAIISGVQAWETGKFAHWNQPDGWWGTPWSFGLVESWSKLIGKPIPEIVSEQFLSLSDRLIDAFRNQVPARSLAITFEDIKSNPVVSWRAILSLAGVDLSASMPELQQRGSRSLPAISPQRRQAITVEAVAALKDRQDKKQKVFEFWKEKLENKGLAELKESSSSSQRVETKIAPSSGTPFSSSYSDSLAELLKAANSSLAITTYKSGHLILASENNGSINTTFRQFVRPMGLAVGPGKLSIGTKEAIESFSNQPGLSKSVEPKGFFDAVFVPRSIVFTGDIAIHEMAYGYEDNQEQLWFINTSFSCLCKFDPNFSFIPVWRPKWVSGLANEDRCHLNGLALVGGRPKYVSALSQTDTAFGWRGLKGTSGVIIDLDSDEVIVEGLSMPHSPRWHQGTLWILESGKGSLSKVDLASGEVSCVATLPGFTRGLAFIGPYALVGLSQVRESVFKDLPVTDSSQERNAGVWVVDTRTGEIAGMLKFDGMVSEIFEVAVIHNAKAATVIAPSELTAFAYNLPKQALEQLAQKPTIG